MFIRAGQPMWLHCYTVCGGGVQKGTVLLAPFSATFQSLPWLPTRKLGPSGADSWVGGFVYVVGPCGSLQRTLLGDWEFLPLPQSPQDFSVIGFEALFPHTGTLGCAVCLAPQLFLLVYLHANVGPPGLQVSALPGLPATTLPRVLSTRLPISTHLLVWMNVSSLTPWLSDFHTVQFSVSSGCFLFLNLLLSFFWFLRRHSVSTYTSILARKF